MLPDLPELAALAVTRALSSEPVVAGERAMLLALDEGNRSASTLIEAEPLQQAVTEGRLLLALSQTPCTALVYLAILRQGDEERLGLQVECRGSEAAIVRFGAPLAVYGGRIEAQGQLWGLDSRARELLGRVSQG